MSSARSGLPTTVFASQHPAVYGSPLDTDGESRVPLYTEQFAADPHAVYGQLREQFGSLAPVWLAPGVPATLVIGYWTALRIMNDPEHFPADPRMWERDIPPECPVLPMMQWRPNALRSAGLEHERYRSTTVAALGRVDLAALHTSVARIAATLIDAFADRGRADLLGDYAVPLVFEVISELIGCDPDVSAQTAAGMAMMFDATADAAEGNRLIVAALGELVRRKRARPGNDMTSSLSAHPIGLSDEEIIQQLVTLYGAASEPLTNLIANALSWMMTHREFGGDVVGGSLSTRDALTHVLFRDPPIANFCMSYPPQPQLIDETVWVPAHQPIVISLAACNNDPAVLGGNIRHNESHLGLGAGPHRCPAQTPAHLIAGEAIDQILDSLPEMALAVPAEQLRWRPGPFHRALESLPVVFHPIASPPPPTR
ncbi:cytochrome P450 [Nocardia higoensis]|uniref:Cytochrome P450 n=1 Tax=Nocardia higoensis TaxID=228599 RepID=A0ABS0DBG9_9NOCA|nr:cytochrome P450 [Nocardia higoensis]MBF6354239.1 cytochrome P450 [Nocardia higoensis]